MIGNKCDLKSQRLISFEEASNLAARWNIPYIETSAKTRENVDRAFSEIFVKIKELKQIRQRNPTSIPSPQNVLTPEEEKAIREDSLRKRVKKFYQNFKKKCIIS